MGVVYRASRGQGPALALKVLRPGLLTPALLARFGREAEVLARLDHPDIARLLDSGVLETPAGSQPFLAMSLVEGDDLRRWSAVPRELEARLELLARVCDAVHHAHGLGIVHRDLKPENILVRADGSPCVLDFGVARLTESDFRATTLMTSTGVLVGTLRYMSPEQADARPGELDARADVYSLGVIGYELLSGVMPYEVPTDSIHRALVTVLTAPPRRLPGVTGQRARGLEAVLGRALAKDPVDRYASAAELAAELRRIAAGRRPLARRLRRGPVVPPIVPLLVLGMLVAFVAGNWLGGKAWFRAGVPALQGADSFEPRAIALLDSAAARVHFTPVQPEALARGVALCDSARSLLRAAPRQPSNAALERASWMLAMETHLRLGEVTLEPGEFEACIAAGERAAGITGPGGEPVLVPAGAGSLFEHLADARYEDPRGVMALAASRLGVYSQPLTHQRRALAWNAEAIAALARMAPRRVPEPESPDVVLRDFAQRTLLADRSAMLARMAFLVDSASLVRAAFTSLAAARAGAPPPLDARAASRLEVRTSYLWAARARLEGNPAAFDSAAAHLHAALAVAHAARIANVETDARMLSAEVGRWRARTRSQRAKARADLEAALAPLVERPVPRRGTLPPRYRALLELRRAQVELDLAALTGDDARAEGTIATLAAVDSLLPATTHPVLRSEVEIEQARAGAILWALTGDRVLLEAAVKRLEAARALVPAADDPGRARRIEAGLRALESGRRGAPDLWFPVPSGSLTAVEAGALARGRERP